MRESKKSDDRMASFKSILGGFIDPRGSCAEGRSVNLGGCHHADCNFDASPFVLMLPTGNVSAKAIFHLMLDKTRVKRIF